MKRRCFLLALYIVMAPSPMTLHAECVGFSLEHYVKYADLVFLGTVTDLQPVGGQKAIVSLNVSRVWKGAVRSRVVLYQAGWSIDSYQFSAQNVGTQYLVFATRLDEGQRRDFDLAEQDEAFAVPVCGGGTSKLPEDGRGFHRQLGPGREPQ